MHGERGSASTRFGWNLIHLLLILVLGGLAPLSYLDGYSPHVGLQTYHFSLFQPPSLPRSLPDDAPAALKAHQLAHSTSSPAQAVDRYVPYLPGIARYFQDSFGHGYPLPDPDALVASRTALPLPDQPIFNGQSAWLAPPDKPPA